VEPRDGHDGDHADGPPVGADEGSSEDEEEAPDISSWAAAAKAATCPGCGAPGALSLGGGLFCPSCGQTALNPG
jgi:hypothetical protein